MKTPVARLISGIAAVACIAAVNPVAAVARGSDSYHLDCASGKDRASGTSPSRAWKTLERVNQHGFRPGDELLIRRGTRCEGMLAPRGSGTSRRPIVVDGYGYGPKAELDGTGYRAAVHLYNVEGWELRNISATNRGNPDQRHNGIWVQLDDFGKGEHYVVSDVRVHDVTGCTCDEPDASSGGIMLSATGTTTPTTFDGIKVRRNKVIRADGTAIGTSSTWMHRPEYPYGPAPYAPIKHLRITHNHIVDAGSDGITVRNAVGALVERNMVDGFALHATDYRTGIWSANSDRTLVQFNEVTHGTGNPQGVSFDIDAGSVGVVFQYNLSHENEGFFLLICNNPESASRDGIVRYNISENDHTPISFYGMVVAGCAAVENTHVYNNTLYSPEAHTLVRNLGAGGGVTFTNNLLVGARDTGSALDVALDAFDHNLYHRVTTLPADAGAVQGDPLLVDPGSATGLNDADGYRLRAGSPALRAGVRVPGAPARDYFGNKVGRKKPHIGAYQGPAR